LENLAEKTEELLQPILAGGSLFVVDIEIKGSGNRPVINIYLDNEKGGVDVDECAKISNELSVVLEAHELVGENYVLNVSSPGLDRPLKDIRQFRKNVGRKVSVSYNSDEGPKTIPGTFTNFNDEVLTVEKENGEPVEISYSTVTHAKVFPAW
jgi:ribosome maturation factor RimP